MARISHTLKILFIDLMWILLLSFITEKYLAVIEIWRGAISHPEYKNVNFNQVTLY